MSRKEYQLERLGGYPDTSPPNPKEYALLHPDDHEGIDEETEVTVEFSYGKDGRIKRQELTVETPGVEETEAIHFAAAKEIVRILNQTYGINYRR